MERTPVQSSNIKSVGFEPGEDDEGTLEIEFTNGKVYQYKNVPAQVHAELMEAESVGGYFHRSIRSHWTGELQS